MIEFIIEVAKKPPVFGDVKLHHFFEDKSGRLCQKCDEFGYNTIADRAGEPYATQVTYSVDTCTPIKRILPRVLKIEWGE
jgi:hypothetical protein